MWKFRIRLTRGKEGQVTKMGMQLAPGIGDILSLSE